ncbi:MAG: metal ABC transporter ATP-binding protein [Candidatus Kapabacteria bacterium]|nr:metal ABC transporter ATP-binding protein [Candidatus Kapabacteria bacterium]
MKNSIILKNITVQHNAKIALDDISVSIPEGTFNACVGPNGSGKTTLIKTFLGLIKPSSGTIEVLGNLNSIPSEFIGYVPQIKSHDLTFPALAIELVASGLRRNWIGRIHKDEKSEALKALDKINSAHLANKQLSSLSGGELQKIFLARVIIRKPKILLLDEPATGIDMVCESNINEVILNMNKNEGVTVIMVTHDWEVAKHHTQSVLLLNKKIVCYGPPEIALSEEMLSQAYAHYGHILHKHEGAAHV